MDPSLRRARIRTSLTSSWRWRPACVFPLLRLGLKHVLNGWAGAALVLAVCAAVYWPFLGHTGYRASEGHRVIPALEMLETGDFARVQMFGLGYLRKPPGMPWAIAGATAVLGESEFASRSVSALSATLMALLAFFVTRRWIGPDWAVAGGLAQALMPLTWGTGRSAEIEALNALGTQAACFGLLALMLNVPQASTNEPRASASGSPFAGRIPSPARTWPAWAALAAAGLIIAALAKGPAAVPVIAGLFAAGILTLGPRRAFNPRLWVALAPAAAVLAAIAWALFRANADQEVVRQDFSEFTWAWERAGRIALMPLAAVGAAMPLALATPFPWGRRARDEARRAGDTTSLPAVRILALAWFFAVALVAITGSGNPRYAAPAAVLLPVVAAYVVRGCISRGPWGFVRERRFWGRFVTLGHSALLAAALLAGAAGVITARLTSPDAWDGKRAGELIAAAVPDGATVWADELIEARPDALHYARRAAEHSGRSLTPAWRKPQMSRGTLPSPDDHPGAVYLALRTDPQSGEWRRYAPALDRGTLVEVARGSIGKYRFAVLQLRRD